MKNLLSTVLLLIFTCINAQNNEFVYKVGVKPDPNKDSIIVKYMSLDITKKKSIFRTEDDKKRDSLESLNVQWNSYDTNIVDNLYFTKDYNKKEFKKHFIQVYNKYYLEIKNPLKWKLLNDKRTIGEFDCKKATVFYGGRNWTAWYTESIPIFDGPYVFKDLPGLIISIIDDKGDYNFELIEIKKIGKKNIPERKSQIKINWEDLKKLQKNYYSDPSRDIRSMSNWVDKNGNKIEIDFRDADEKERKKLKRFNNPIEIENKVDYETK